jgi:hypothetical protein
MANMGSLNVMFSPSDSRPTMIASTDRAQSSDADDASEHDKPAPRPDRDAVRTSRTTDRHRPPLRRAVPVDDAPPVDWEWEEWAATFWRRTT